jgi:hypothetical protein
MADAQRPGLIVGLLLGLLVALGGPLLAVPAVATFAGNPGPIPSIAIAVVLVIVCLVLGAVVVAFLPPFLATGDDRRASATHAWIGAREVRRLLGKASAAIEVPTTLDEAERWLAATPDSEHLRPLRFEMLLFVGRFGEARTIVGQLPRRTPLDEYRATEAVAMIDDQESGAPDLARLREAASRVPAREDRAEATASLAVFEARRLSSGASWRVPLVTARSQIPESDVRILVRDLAAPIFAILMRRVVLPLAVFVVLVALTLGAFTLL